MIAYTTPWFSCLIPLHFSFSLSLSLLLSLVLRLPGALNEPCPHAPSRNRVANGVWILEAIQQVCSCVQTGKNYCKWIVRHPTSWPNLHGCLVHKPTTWFQGAGSLLPFVHPFAGAWRWIRPIGCQRVGLGSSKWSLSIAGRNRLWFMMAFRRI